MLGRERREDDHVDVVLLDAGILDRGFRSEDREVCRAHSVVGEAALLDARSLENPVVRGVDAEFGPEVFVRHATGRT